MGESGKVIAIVEAHGGYFSASRHIRVTAGGCA
jgi:predicted secreted protein